MKKRGLALMMAALLAVSALSGCGKDKGGSGDTAASGGTENEEGGAEKQYRLALVVNQKFGDKASMDETGIRGGIQI